MAVLDRFYCSALTTVMTLLGMLICIFLLQDTVVGLQALSDFASKVYSHNFNIQATISTDALTHTFSVSQNNALVLQSLKVCHFLFILGYTFIRKDVLIVLWQWIGITEDLCALNYFFFNP